MEPLFGLSVVDGILMVHIQAIGAAVYLRDAVGDKVQEPDLEARLVDKAAEGKEGFEIAFPDVREIDPLFHNIDFLRRHMEIPKRDSFYQ
jgi:hypothetical protein